MSRARSGNTAMRQFLEHSDMRYEPVIVQPSSHPLRKEFPSKYVIDFRTLDIGMRRSIYILVRECLPTLFVQRVLTRDLEYIRETEALLEGIPHVSTIISRGLLESEKLTKVLSFLLAALSSS